MNHVDVLREKIGRLRVEIAQIQEMNNEYRIQGRKDEAAQIAHGHRHERQFALSFCAVGKSSGTNGPAASF